MRSLASDARPPLEHGESPEDMDTTMPTWGLSANINTSDVSGDSDNDIYPAEVDEDEGLDYDMDGASDADSEPSDAEPLIYLSSPAAYDYNSDLDDIYRCWN